MNKRSIICILAVSIFVLVLSGCGESVRAPKITAINTDPVGPFSTNTDVLLTAEVEGIVAEYRWTVTGGILRQADAHSAQQVKYPVIGVTQSALDNVASILNGAGLDYQVVLPDIVRDPVWITDFNVLFINSSDEIEMLGGESVLSTWVYAGGSLYLSGKAADYLINLWPGTVKFPSPNPYVVSTGADGEILNGQILDESCSANLGKTSVEIGYSSKDWPVITGVTKSVNVMVTVDATEILSPALIDSLPSAIDPKKMPAAVSFEFGKGIVLYTSFHNGVARTVAEKNLLGCFAAILCAHPLAPTNHEMLSRASYLFKTEYSGLIGADDQISYVLHLTNLDDVYFVLNSPAGVLKLDINGPASADSTVSGPSPLTAVFQEVTDGIWILDITALDTAKYDRIPFLLTVGYRTSILQLLTWKPSAIWRTPFEPGEYSIILRVLNSNFQLDEKIIEVEVQ